MCLTANTDAYFTIIMTVAQGFYQTEGEFRLNFANIKHDYTQEFHQSSMCFVSLGQQTAKFLSDCGAFF